MLSKRKIIEDLQRQVEHINKRLDRNAPMPDNIRARVETQRDVYQSMIDNINNGAYTIKKGVSDVVP